MKDLLTIALPVYNRTQFVKSALDSAVNQSVKCRILLVDNNSPHDEFKKIIDSYNNPLFKYVKTEVTVPQDENFNNCFRYAETPWVTILHDDDYLHFQFVELVQYIFGKFGQNIGGFATDCFVSMDEWGAVNKPLEFTRDIKKVNEGFFYFAQLSPFPGVMLNREKALKIGGFINDLHPIADFDFWYRYSKVFGMLYVNQQFAYYRISPNQSTNRLIYDMINNVYEYRLKLIESGRHNNFLTKTALEKSRLNNIRYFEKTYGNVPPTDILKNNKRLKKAEKLLKNKWVVKFFNWYTRWLSFSRP